ncbi:Conserved_hypothetical protein [Hexamita inflata]|uniref:Uncharacterized protein n=1 Tax=Hexamita inflata TaxID=28002 RepID=A0AA86QQT4_9EUKA|nr:Conserved hypothetical protein [Hexamita inflata]
MFVLLSALQVTLIKHGQVMKDIKIQTKLNYWTKYEIFQLDIPETYNDPYNMQNYSLIVNFQATRAVQLVVCAYPTYHECIEDGYSVSFSNTTGAVQIDGYTNKLGLVSQQIYLMFSLSGRNAAASVTFQAQSVYILSPQSKTVIVAANQDLYLMAARCDQSSFILLIDSSAAICSSDNAHATLSTCEHVQTGKSSYAFNSPNKFTFITVFAASEDQILTVQMNIQTNVLNVNETNTRKIYLNQNCFIMNQIQFSKLTTFTFTQEVQNKSHQVVSEFIDSDNVSIEQSSQPIVQLMNFDLSVITSANVTVPIMPWTNDDIPFILVWLVVAKDLTQLRQNELKQIQSNHVVNNLVALPGTSNLQNLSYDIAFVGGETDLQFYVTHKYGMQCDSCTTKNGRCQLIIDNTTQIKVADNFLYYIIYSDFQSSIIYAPLQVMEPNMVVQDIVQRNNGSRYYRMKTKNIKYEQLQITSNDSTAFIKVVLSSSIYLPQITDNNVNIATGIGAVKLLIPDSIGSDELFFHVQNLAKNNIEVKIEFTQQQINERFNE